VEELKPIPIPGMGFFALGENLREKNPEKN